MASAGEYELALSLALLCWQKIALGNKGWKKETRAKEPSSSCNSSRRGANKSNHSDCLGTQKTSRALPDSRACVYARTCICVHMYCIIHTYVCIRVYALWGHYQSGCCVWIFLLNIAQHNTISVGRRSFAFVSALISRLVMRPYNSSLPDELTNWLCVVRAACGARDFSCSTC